ncbi:hypothetical protein PGUG_00578 [Meyerozyma guilliermondii ATCC 6260]|uniref:Uncharacterized protein n=1 Tax=Meyerozyma guilliermondii (strain ATCC 6260 / CBS 566 / DSM 6381 / JCM 1539 / NBRC 10279 / NRRL Y-324) TaxID=294746 RepID=A5DBC3_PICGU|nr:uncharacterized protein PGUG_00578 [Meyerozyma guilliermondii ATCC 6260]EDK36480.2 hypothetical protein PGUG_00578 [Meyerozyma guilliermondii ATCC 6260]
MSCFYRHLLQRRQDILPQKLLQKSHLRQEIHPLRSSLLHDFHPHDFHLLDFHLHNFHLHQQTQTIRDLRGLSTPKVSSSPHDYSRSLKRPRKENIIHFLSERKRHRNTLFVISRHLLQTPFIIVHSTTASSVSEIVSYIKSTFSSCIQRS